jgi:hypothetical protein
MPPIRRNKNTAVERVADKLDMSLAALGEALGVSRWTPGWWNSHGGEIPEKHRDAVKKLAKQRKVRVTLADFHNA